MREQMNAVTSTMEKLRARTVSGHLNELYLELWSRRTHSQKRVTRDTLPHLGSLVWRKRMGQRAMVSRSVFETAVKSALPEISRWYVNCDREAQLLNALAKSLRDTFTTMNAAFEGTGEDGIKKMPQVLNAVKQGLGQETELGFMMAKVRK